MFENAHWIWGTAKEAPDTYYEFLLPVTAKPGKSYRLLLSCDSDYELHEGDRLLSFGQYPDYGDYKAAETVGLALSAGEHLLTLTVWFQGVNTSCYLTKKAGVIFTLTEDGETVLVSSEKILCRPSPRYENGGKRLITGQLGLSYTAVCGGAEQKPAPSVVLPDPGFTYIPRPIEKLYLGERLKGQLVACGGYRRGEGGTDGEIMDNCSLLPRDPASVGDGGISLIREEGEDGVFALFDLGRETSGFAELAFTVSSPCTALLGWGEHNDGTRCDTAIWIRSFSCRLVTKEGENRYFPAMRRLGCRYLQLFLPTGRVTFHHVGIREVSYPLREIGKPLSDPRREEIRKVCINTLKQCMHDHYEDCPWREQSLYTFDSRNQMLCGYKAFGEYAYPRANLELISHGLRPDGLLGLCYPTAGELTIPGFNLAYILQMREYMEYSGDVSFLSGKYDFLTALLRKFTDRLDDTGLCGNFYGETGGYWNFYEWSEGMVGCLNDNSPSVDAPLNAFLSLACQNMAVIARRLGKDADADAFLLNAGRINGALFRTYYDPEAGLFRSFTDREPEKFSVLTNALCLLCGAADGIGLTNILQIVAANGAADTGRYVIPATLSMNGFRYDALLHEDREKYRTVILEEIDAAYGRMLAAGATSFWETAVGKDDFDGAGSLCHGWSALPLYYYDLLL